MAIFSGLLFNVLVLLLSTTKACKMHPDKENRKILLNETFYNLSYTILMSLVSIIILLVQKINIPSSKELFCIDFLIKRSYTSSEIIQELLAIAAYWIFINICVTILLILYNIFKLFELDIQSED
jgi:hypothetical protein